MRPVLRNVECRKTNIESVDGEESPLRAGRLPAWVDESPSTRSGKGGVNMIGSSPGRSGSARGHKRLGDPTVVDTEVVQSHVDCLGVRIHLRQLHQQRDEQFHCTSAGFQPTPACRSPHLDSEASVEQPLRCQNEQGDTGLEPLHYYLSAMRPSGSCLARRAPEATEIDPQERHGRIETPSEIGDRTSVPVPIYCEPPV